ncbi:MAG TPA: hypothetical protein VF103_11310 [Polyangiaceae bacterium]
MTFRFFTAVLGGLGLLVSAEAFAAPPDAARPGNVCRESGSIEHVLGGGFDIGYARDTIALRYLQVHRAGVHCGASGTVGWLSYGPEIRTDLRGAWLGYAMARAGAFGDAGGGAVELGIGAGTDFDRTVASGIVGLFYSVYYFDLGGSIQYAIAHERPYWLGGLAFAVRFHVPLFEYAEYDRVRK